MEDEKAYLEKIAELEKRVRELERDLVHDSLTNLKTRAFFEEETKTYISAIEGVKKGNRQNWFGFINLSILFIDIDHLKKINDTYGHDNGDLVLKSIAKTIKDSVRDGDTVARWGGEEMVVSLVGATEKDAIEKAEQIRSKVGELSFDFDPELRVTLSCGVACSNSDISYDELIKNADESMYRAKNSGRNKVVAFSILV